MVAEKVEGNHGTYWAPYATVTRAYKLSHLFVSCFAEAALLNPNLFGNFTRIDLPV